MTHRMTHREKDELIFGLALLMEKLAVQALTVYTDGYMAGKLCQHEFQYGRHGSICTHSLPAPLGGEAPPPEKIGRR